MEENIYSRSVNKTGLGFLVVDEKAIDRNFSAQQLNFSNLSWVQCDRCEKWRCLVSADGIPEEDTENLPDKWFCELNNDVENNSCDAPEQDQSWYIERVDKLTGASQHDTPLLFADKSQKNQVPASEQLDDKVLHHILALTSHKRKTKMISKNYIHDSLLNTTDSLTALERIETQVKETEKAVDVGTPCAQVPTETKQPVGVAGDTTTQMPDVRLATSSTTTPLATSTSHVVTKPQALPTAASAQTCKPTATPRVISKEQATTAAAPTPKDQFLHAATAKKPVAAAAPQITRGVSPDVSLPEKRKGQPKEEEVIDLCHSEGE